MAVIAFFAFADDPEKRLGAEKGAAKAAEQAIIFYANWSGTGTSYNFFAPSVAISPRMRFQVRHISGQVTNHTLGADLEMRRRVSTMTRTANTTKSEPLFARSIAALAFSQVADAERVTVIFEDYRLPTLERAADGEKATWTPRFTATFIKVGDQLVSE